MLNETLWHDNDFPTSKICLTACLNHFLQISCGTSRVVVISLNVFHGIHNLNQKRQKTRFKLAIFHMSHLSSFIVYVICIAVFGQKLRELENNFLGLKQLNMFKVDVDLYVVVQTNELNPF